MRVGKADGEAWLRLSEAACVLGVSLNTLRRWSDSGKLICYRSPGGHRRYRRADIEDLLRRQAARPPSPTDDDPVNAPPFALGDDRRSAALPALTALAQAAAEGIGVSACVIGSTVDDGALRVAASYSNGAPLAPAPGQPLTRESAPAADEVRHTGRRVVIADIAATNVLTPVEVEACRVRGEKAVLALPLSAGGRLLGVMRLVEHRAPRAFTGANIAFAEFIARQAAGVIAAAEAEDAPPGRDETALPGVGRESVASGADDDRHGPAEQAVQLGSRIARATSAQGERDVDDCLTAFEKLAADLATGLDVAVFELTDGLLRRLGTAPGGNPPVVVTDGDVELAAALAGGSPRVTVIGGAPVCLLPLCAGASAYGVAELSGAPGDVLLSVAAALAPAGRLLATTLAARTAVAALQRRVDDLEVIVQAGAEDTASLSTDEVLLSIIRRLSELTHSPVADAYAVEGGTLRALISLEAGRNDPEWEGVVIPIARRPCSRRAIETGEITVAASLDDPVLGENGRFSLERWGYQSQLSMPLIAVGRVIGLVELSDYVARDFAEDLELIRGLGRVAARALENARLFEQVERRSRVLNELVEIGTFASTCRDFDTVLRHVAERLLRTLDAANCDIYQSSTDGLRCVASFDRSGFDDEAVGQPLDVGTYPTIARTVSTGQVLVVAGPDDPKLSERERELYREFGFNSEVCVPLIVNETLFGLIDIYDTRPRRYSEYLTFLRSLGMSLAGAFASTLLFEQLERRTTVLREIVELGALAAQGGELPELLATVAGRLRAAIAVADCDVYTLEGDEMRCVASVDERGLDQEAIGRTLDVSSFPVTELAVRTREAMVVADLDDPRLTDDERTQYKEWDYQSLASIPLCSGDEVLGVLDLFDTRRRDYGDDLDFLRTVGQIVAGAIRNARLVSALTERNRELNRLVDLGRLPTN